MNDAYLWIMIAVIALVTAAIRSLPFLVFGGGRRTPAIIEKLSRVLPYAIMGMLVVYCLKDTSFSSLSGFMPATLACSVVILLYLWRRSTLVSIVSGTVCYMLLVQFIF